MARNPALNGFRLVLLAGALLVGAACAPLPMVNPPAPPPALASAPMPRWQAGNHWVYDDGYELKVTETAGDMAMFLRLDEKNRWLSRFGFLTVDSFDGDQERQLVGLDGSSDGFYPLAVGKSVLFTKRYQAGGQQRVHQHAWLVEGKEQITVPAGTFDCWVILFATRSTRSEWRSFERWWYNPQVNHYVRLDYQYGDSPFASRKLTAVLQDSPAPSLKLKLSQTLQSASEVP